MTKEQLIRKIIVALSADLAVLTAASRAAHDAATHPECLPDNKYDTTALEASYIAQGQANRAQEIRVALESYRTLEWFDFDDETPVRLTALVTLENEEGEVRKIFIGPHAGGLKVTDGDDEVVVITPVSPLGSRLLGLRCGDEVRYGAEAACPMYTIAGVC